MNTEQIAPLTDSQTPQDGLEAPPFKVKRHPVIELFGPVIQGEGSQAGNQTLFIRFGGCDYRCEKCDSLHAVLPKAVLKNANWMSASEIAAKCLQLKDETGVRWVTFSGGNPLMHNLDELVDRLLMFGFHINVETQGTLWQDWLYKCSVITVSPKSPGMGEKFEEDKFRKFIWKVNGIKPLCIKVVVFSAVDLEFALLVKAHVEDVSANWLFESGEPQITYYLSLGNSSPPRIDDDFEAQQTWDQRDLSRMLLSDYAEMCNEILPDRRLKDFRFLPQLHVLVYGNEASR